MRNNEELINEVPSYHQMRINRITGRASNLRRIHDPSSNTRERVLKEPCAARLTLELGNFTVQPILDGNGQKIWTKISKKNRKLRQS